MAGKLVLCRHGQSDWNLKNLFTGWTDVGLTDKGRAEALAAGRLLKEQGYEFDIAFTSVLKRAIGTLWIMLEEMDRVWIPVERRHRLWSRTVNAIPAMIPAMLALKTCPPPNRCQQPWIAFSLAGMTLLRRNSRRVRTC